MATERRPSNPAERRHPFGPRPVGALIPALTRPAFKARSPAAAQLMADWPLMVGPDLAGVTLPRRLTGDTLVLACAGPMALELQHMAGPLIERINAQLGRVLVRRLRFVQAAIVPPAARPRAPRRPAAPVALPGLPGGPLREALEALGSALRTDRA